MGEQIDRAIRSLVDALWACGITELETVSEFKKRFIERALREASWNQCAAAEKLGIHRNTLARQMNDLGIAVPDETRRNRSAYNRFEHSPLLGRAAAGR